MKKTLLIKISIILCVRMYAQTDSSAYTLSYLDKSTRFAWLTYGGDINFQTGGTSQLLIDGLKKPFDFGASAMPRLTIGGIHFWGHADFYVSFPLSFLTLQNTPQQLAELTVHQGVETGMRLYPLKLQPGRISPFAGISFRLFRFSHASEIESYGNDVPNYGRFIHPIQFGLTYTSTKWHISGSAYYTYQNQFDYHITPTETAAVELDQISFNVSFLRFLDTDQSMRTPQAAKQINADYIRLKNQNLLSAWFFGLGPSAALQMSQSPYLKENFSFFYDNYSAAIMPDLAFGRYFSKVDANLNLAYRTYGDKFTGFGTEIKIRRHSLGLESVKFLFNYLGFVPFVGPILSFENLQTSQNGIDYKENKLALGVTFGWDIRVTKTGTSLLRTNLRYYPNLHMEVEDEKMMFDHLEFNFIQWVQFIGRKKALRY